jgi:hypothetical protein
MKISQLIKELSAQQKEHGDIEVVMQATLLSDGFSASGCANPNFADVFESTVETLRVKGNGGGKSLRIYWQK